MICIDIKTLSLCYVKKMYNLKVPIWKINKIILSPRQTSQLKYPIGFRVACYLFEKSNESIDTQTDWFNTNSLYFKEVFFAGFYYLKPYQI